VEVELLVRADRLVGSSDAVLVIEDTAIPKKARFRLVSLRNMPLRTPVCGEMPAVLALRLFLPES
jgi:hypothetical protein